MPNYYTRRWSPSADLPSLHPAQEAQRPTISLIENLHFPQSATTRLAELEKALAAATKRADTAEVRAVRAERQAASWGRHRTLGAAVARIAELEATVADLQARLATAHTAPDRTSQPGPNRAARRAAERDSRRRRH